MKISEMTNDQATEAMIRLCGPFSAICDDEEMLAIIDEIANAGEKNPDMPLLKQMAKFLPKIVAFALQKHKQDVYEIIGALQMVPAAKVGGMNFAATVKAVQDSYDDILAGFFTHSVGAGKRNETASA